MTLESIDLRNSSKLWRRLRELCAKRAMPDSRGLDIFGGTYEVEESPC
jgi:hypothetical protein